MSFSLLLLHDNIHMFLPINKLVNLIRPILLIIVELALDIEVHHRVHLVHAPLVRSRMLRILAHINLQLLMLLKLLSNHEVSLLDHELDRQAIGILLDFTNSFLFFVFFLGSNFGVFSIRSHVFKFTWGNC